MPDHLSMVWIKSKHFCNFVFFSRPVHRAKHEIAKVFGFDSNHAQTIRHTIFSPISCGHTWFSPNGSGITSLLRPKMARFWSKIGFFHQNDLKMPLSQWIGLKTVVGCEGRLFFEPWIKKNSDVYLSFRFHEMFFVKNVTEKCQFF